MNDSSLIDFLLAHPYLEGEVEIAEDAFQVKISVQLLKEDGYPHMAFIEDISWQSRRKLAVKKEVLQFPRLSRSAWSQVEFEPEMKVAS